MDSVAKLTKRGDDAARELRPSSGLEHFDADAALLHVLFSRLESQRAASHQTFPPSPTTAAPSAVVATNVNSNNNNNNNTNASTYSAAAAAASPTRALIGDSSPFFRSNSSNAGKREEEDAMFVTQQQRRQQQQSALVQLAVARGEEGLTASPAFNTPGLGPAPQIPSCPGAFALYPLDVRIGKGGNESGGLIAGIRSEFEMGRTTLHRMMKAVRDLVAQYHAAMQRSHQLERQLAGMRQMHEKTAAELRALQLASEYLAKGSTYAKAVGGCGNDDDDDNNVRTEKQHQQQQQQQKRQGSQSSRGDDGGGFDEAWRLEAENANRELDEQVQGSVENFRSLVMLHRHSRGIAQIVCPDAVATSFLSPPASASPKKQQQQQPEQSERVREEETVDHLLERHPAVRRGTRKQLVATIRALDEKNQTEGRAVARVAQPPTRVRVTDVLRQVDEFLMTWSGGGNLQDSGAGDDRNNNNSNSGRSGTSASARDKKASASSAAGADSSYNPLERFGIATSRTEAQTVQVENLQQRVEGITIVKRTMLASSSSQQFPASSPRSPPASRSLEQQQQQSSWASPPPLVRGSPSSTLSASPLQPPRLRESMDPSHLLSTAGGRTLVKCRPQDRRVISLATMLVEALCVNRHSPFIVIRSVVPDETVLSRAMMRSHGLGPVWQAGGLANFCVSACPPPMQLLQQCSQIAARIQRGAYSSNNNNNNNEAAVVAAATQSKLMLAAADVPGVISFLSAFSVPPSVSAPFQTSSAKAEAARRYLLKENMIRCYSSSTLPGTMTAALAGPYVDPTRPFFVTANESSGEYVEIFLTRAVVCPTGYGFASCHVSGAASYPRSWRLEASTDAGVSWTLLRRHTDDRTLHHACPRAVWALSSASSDKQRNSSGDGGAASGNCTASAQSSSNNNNNNNTSSGGGGEGAVYSRFRISNEGPNSSGTWHLNISSIEIYGRVLTLHSAAAPMIAEELVPFFADAKKAPLSPEHTMVMSEAQLRERSPRQEDAAAASSSCQFRAPHAGLGAPPAAFVPKKEEAKKKKSKQGNSPTRKK